MKKYVPVILLLVVMAACLLVSVRRMTPTLDDVYKANSHETLLRKYNSYRVYYDCIGVSAPYSSDDCVVTQDGCYSMNIFDDSYATMQFVGKDMTFSMGSFDTLYLNYVFFDRNGDFTTIASTADVHEDPAIVGGTEEIVSVEANRDGYEVAINTYTAVAAETYAPYAACVYEEGDYLRYDLILNRSYEVVEALTSYVKASSGDTTPFSHVIVQHGCTDFPDFVTAMRGYVELPRRDLMQVKLNFEDQTVIRRVPAGTDFYFETYHTVYSDADCTKPVMPLYATEDGTYAAYYFPVLEQNVTLYLTMGE